MNIQKKSFWGMAVVVLSLVVLGVVGCSKKANPAAPAAPAPPPGASSIVVSGTTFSPAAVTITAGQSVQWSNLQAGGHNVVQIDNLADCNSVTSGGFTSGAPGAVDTYTHAFAAAGTYFFKCQPHCPGGMKGTVVVQ
jgi:plastocyanin